MKKNPKETMSMNELFNDWWKEIHEINGFENNEKSRCIARAAWTGATFITFLKTFTTKDLASYFCAQSVSFQAEVLDLIGEKLQIFGKLRGQSALSAVVDLIENDGTWFVETLNSLLNE